MAMELLIGLAVALFTTISARPLNATAGQLTDRLDRSERSTESCQPPDNITELFQRLNANIDTSMYLRHVGSSRNGHPFLHDELNMNEAMESFYYGDKECPSSVSDDPNDPLWMRSLCPWYYNITELPHGHYPAVIPQAVCKCSNCIDSNLNQCERVSTNIRILEETGCQDGFYTYKPKTVIHYVGCTCSKRRVTESGGSGCGPWGCPT